MSLFILVILKPLYRDHSTENTVLLDGFTSTALESPSKQFTMPVVLTALKLSQTFHNCYHIGDIINPLYCHPFNITVII